MEKHPTAMVERFSMASCGLQGCVFVGHTNTDMDSVASAIGAAELYKGTAARSAAGGDNPRQVNGEILHALEFSRLELPPFFQDLPDAGKTDGPAVCFVDTNHPTQMIAPMNTAEHLHRIKGVIDHHNCALQTPSPIFTDIRPWGSCCSIIAHHYVRAGAQMPTPVARVLLCGILSDTINLMSPTTTDADRLMMAMLKILARVTDLDEVARLQFKAKTASFVAMAPFALVRADMKCFDSGAVRFAWATVEVTDVEGVYAKAADMLGELRVLKEEKTRQYTEEGADHPELVYAFLSIVDLSTQTSVILLCGGREVALAKEAFGGTLSQAPGIDAKRFEELAASSHLTLAETMMDIGSRVSRKKEFLPPVVELLESGWTPAVPMAAMDELAPIVQTTHGGTELCEDGACLNRTLSSPKGAFGIVTPEQRLKAKANPPPPAV